MANKKTMESINQARVDTTRDAKNANNGFKSGMSSGTNGAGDSYRRNK
ncbi:MAG: hypothetical protein ACRCWY_03200 [Cellulosilyticaceae bacterium]